MPAPERPSPDHFLQDGVWVLTWEPVRVLRAPLLERADIEFNKALDQGLPTQPISEYRQQLRDITKGPDPANPSWPAPPWEQT
ncbi:hypothetical protein D3C87_2034250 [compost metagenome]